MDVRLPADLVDSVVARRVIPFIGAGFSAGLGLPDWDALLGRLAQELDSPFSYDEIREMCSGDRLQMAEYFLLKSDKSIGPLRHTISRALMAPVNPVLSGCHVELVNLGAPQIYTTNYDDVIEQCLKRLGEPVDVVALPKDVATSTGKKTQVVKYHGDLRHESTLVLTESSYYARLDFESPMDLKFRSDLLGRSVLFIGYSFGDINIRIIWYKLMRLMKDIPSADRPSSYIVRFAPNPVLQLLYEDVGIKTLVLDPDRIAKTPAELTKLLAGFLHELASAAADQGRIPGHESPLFVSQFLIERVAENLREPKSGLRSRGFAGRSATEAISRVSERRIPRELAQAYEKLLEVVLAELGHEVPVHAGVLAATFAIQGYGPCRAVTELTVLAMTRLRARDPLLESGASWKVLWGEAIREEVARRALDRLAYEIDFHRSEGGRDDDLAYCVDVAYRIKNGYVVSNPSDELRTRASDLLDDAAKLYPAIARYEPIKDGLPQVQSIIDDIESAQANDESEDQEDIEF